MTTITSHPTDRPSDSTVFDTFTEAQLDTLPFGTTIVDTRGDAHRKSYQDTWLAGSADVLAVGIVALHAPRAVGRRALASNVIPVDGDKEG